MNIQLECVSCLISQSLRAAAAVTDDLSLQEQVVREVLRLLAGIDFSTPQPVVAQFVYRRVRELTGVEDPYREAKHAFNRLGLALLPELRTRVAASPDPLLAAARLAASANIMDLGARTDLTEAEAAAALREAFDAPLPGDDEAFVRRVAEAGRILYLADNAGEIALDRLLIEVLGPSRVTVAVRGRAVINDALLEDAREVGLTELVTVIDNGSDAPGTILSDCSPAFLEHYHAADLIIAKGQGNYESLSHEPAGIFFLFKVKCPVLGEHAGLPLGSLALLASRK
ncbi:DUF89 family protein [Myxococcota bacterium]|nr:DUF89 family protein [Myxococcota bacterium]